MKKRSKPNISPLEIEIKNKITAAYLFSIAARNHQINLGELFLMQPEPGPGKIRSINDSTTKNQQNENQ